MTLKGEVIHESRSRLVWSPSWFDQRDVVSKFESNRFRNQQDYNIEVTANKSTACGTNDCLSVVIILLKYFS